MSELIRNLTGRLRELVGNQRRAPRRQVHLPVKVSPLHTRARVVGPRSRPPELEGQTYDLSATGVAFIVPAIHVGGRYLAGEGRRLELALALTDEPVRLEVAPMRYERLEEAEAGYLIGAQIIKMSQSDRVRYTDYLRTLS